MGPSSPTAPAPKVGAPSPSPPPLPRHAGLSSASGRTLARAVPCSAGGSPQGWGHNTGAPSPQLCTGCRVPTPAPSPSVRCLALTMASPALAPRGAWARAGSGTSWRRCPGRGPGWAWTSCRSQVRSPGGAPQGTMHPGWGALCRPAGGTRGGMGCQESPSFAPGTGSNSSQLSRHASPHAGTLARPQAWWAACQQPRPLAPQGATGRPEG